MAGSYSKIKIESLRKEIIGIDQPVPLLDGTTLPYTNLDNAASTPGLKYVKEKIDEFLPWYSSVHRGTGFKSLLSTQVYDDAHEIVAGFVGADLQNDCVIFTKNTTEAINKMANRMQFKPNDVVICTSAEHHSNDLPWRAKAQTVHIGLMPDGSLDINDLAINLERYKGRVKLVATTGASNVSGWMPPIHQMAEMAHQAGALIVVDCAQLAPHRAIQMGSPGSPQHLDFVVLSAHKMYAPFGTGALVGSREFFSQGAPDYSGGGTIEVVTLNEVYWTDPPERDEAGSPNVIGAVALAASIRYLTNVGMEAVAEHEKELTRYILKRLSKIRNIRLFGSSDPERLEDRLGVISLNLEGINHALVAAILSFEGAIAVRDGCFCAHPYVLRLLGISEQEFQYYKERVLKHDRSEIPGMVRLSFGCYNNTHDIDRLIEMLERIQAGDYQGKYELEKSTGAYYPQGFKFEELGKYFKI